MNDAAAPPTPTASAAEAVDRPARRRPEPRRRPADRRRPAGPAIEALLFLADEPLEALLFLAEVVDRDLAERSSWTPLVDAACQGRAYGAARPAGTEVRRAAGGWRMYSAGAARPVLRALGARRAAPVG